MINFESLFKSEDNERFQELYKMRIWGDYMTPLEESEYNLILDKYEEKEDISKRK